MKKLFSLLAISFLISCCIPCISYANEDYKDSYISDYQKECCYFYGEIYNISPQMLMALIETESSGNMDAINQYSEDAYAYGICQISTVHGTKYNNEPKQIAKCCTMLTEFLNEEPDIAFALDRFNGNSKAWKNYNKGIVSDYAQKILDRTWEIEEAQGLHDY